MNFKLKNTKLKIETLFEIFSSGAQINEYIKIKANKSLGIHIKDSGDCKIVTFVEPRPIVTISIPILKDPDVIINKILIYKDEIEISIKNFPDIVLEVES